jgi:uncharacterized phage protein (TIGR01671 family)
MREIKFRAWDRHGKMVYSDQGLMRDFADMYFDQFETPVMQFTGLKDKHGKEIYEGDLIAEFAPIENPYSEEEREITGLWEVQFKKHGNLNCRQDLSFICSLIRGGEKGCYSIEVAEHNEVIGNIYENGDLLEEPRQAA